MQALLGKKIGMTQIFDLEGRMVPVTVLLAGPCTVVQKKDEKTDGYNALQIGFEEIPMKKANKPLKGHFQKAKVPAFRVLKEIRPEPGQDIAVGQMLKTDIFNQGDFVDVVGISKGKGFQGVMKRHHFKGGAGSHGSMFHRAPGSIGSSSDPSRVFKGTRMAGHMGSEQCTVQNLEVLQVDADKDLLIIKGSVPGFEESFVFIRKSSKARKVQVKKAASTDEKDVAAKKKEKK